MELFAIIYNFGLVDSDNQYWVGLSMGWSYNDNNATWMTKDEADSAFQKLCSYNIQSDRMTIISSDDYVISKIMDS